MGDGVHVGGYGGQYYGQQHGAYPPPQGYPYPSGGYPTGGYPSYNGYPPNTGGYPPYAYPRSSGPNIIPETNPIAQPNSSSVNEKRSFVEGISLGNGMGLLAGGAALGFNAYGAHNSSQGSGNHSHGNHCNGYGSRG